MNTPPRWIAPFFFVAATATLAALAFMLVREGGRTDHGEHLIADIVIDRDGRTIREHCTTCHVEGARPVPDGGISAAAIHPDISPHRIDELGCTGCHLGEGMAFDHAISHGLPGLGERRVLTGRDVQASCFTCHAPQDLPGAGEAWAGYRLFVRHACNTCHAIGDGPGGGVYGPRLDSIGTVLGVDAIQEAIREPRLAPPNSIMPRFPLSQRQSRQIAIFLKSRRGLKMAAGSLTAADVDRHRSSVLAPPEERIDPDERLLNTAQCLACHQFGESDGRIAPDLTYSGALRDAPFLAGFLDNPTAWIPGAAMPRVPLAKGARQELLALLADEAAARERFAVAVLRHRAHGDGGQDRHAGGDEQASAKTMYMALCQRCHAAGGDGYGPIQPNLSGLPRVFAANADFFRAVSDERLRHGLAKGVPGTSMPGYERLLYEGEREAILNLVFEAFVGIDRFDKVLPAPFPEAGRPAGVGTDADALYRVNCSHCHGLAGTGRGEDALLYQPRPRNLRNRLYFATLDDERIARTIRDGVPGTAMPAFRDHLSHDEIRALVARVRGFTAEEQ